MKKLQIVLVTVALVLAFTVNIQEARAATYPLPDPAISVVPNYSNTTTIVVLNGVTYRGPSAFYYVRECDKPDGARFHCNVMQEAGVVLTAQDGSGARVVVDLVVQFASTLITSGHNWWRSTQTVLSGDVTTQ